MDSSSMINAVVIVVITVIVKKLLDPLLDSIIAKLKLALSATTTKLLILVLVDLIMFAYISLFTIYFFNNLEPATNRDVLIGVIAMSVISGMFEDMLRDLRRYKQAKANLAIPLLT